MNTDALQTFTALCRCKNFSRTADALFVTQSTVTKRIAELESELGKKLFRRDNKRVELTGEGRIFQNYAERIIELQEAGVREMNTHVKYGNTLKLGAPNSIYECHLIPLITRYLADGNAARVSIDHSADLLLMLQDGLLDLVFSYLPFHRAGFECLPFHLDKLVLVTGYDNDAFKDGILKGSLTEINYLMCNFALQEVGRYIRELFPDYYQFSFEIDNSTKLIPYLTGGAVYSFLPLKMVEGELANRTLRVIPLLDFETPLIESYCVGRTKNKDVWQNLFC